jgi:hypothetical protein
MSYMNSGLGSSLAASSKFRLVFIGLLFLVVAMPLTTLLAGAASGSMSMGYYTTSTPNKIYVTIQATDSQIPSPFTITLSSTYKGVTFSTEAVVQAPTSTGSVSVTFVVPFQGNGNYLFVGSVHGPQGKLWLKTSIDPFIKTGH